MGNACSGKKVSSRKCCERCQRSESNSSRYYLEPSYEVPTTPNYDCVPDLVPGFAMGLLPERILGSVNEFGEVMFLVKFKGINEADYVRAEEAIQLFPEIVERYYRSVKLSSADNEKTPKDDKND